MNKSDTKERLKNWLKNKWNLALIATLLAAFIVRVYHFVLASGQTYWWDEAEYMATAKHWAFGVPYELNPQRPPLFQLLAAGLLKLGIGEEAIKFILVVVPSIIFVWVVYLLGKEMFNKKIGVLAAAGTAFVWSLLFWSSRFQPDFFSITFQALAILFFWKLFKHNKKSHAIFAGFFTALGFYFKISALLVPIIIFVFVIFKDGLSLFKNKGYWITFAAFIITLVPFGIWQFFLFGNPTAFAPSYSGDFNEGRDFGWMALNYFYQFPKALFFILFLVGLVTVLFNLVLTADLALKNKERRLDGGIFSIIALLVLALFYIFYIRGIIEDRWIFLIIPFLMFLSSIAIVKISDYLARYGKIFAHLFIIAIFVILIYTQVNHATSLIEVKKGSYLPIKDASLYIKSVSSPSEGVLSVSYTQATTYTERPVYTYAKLNYTNFTYLLEEKRPSYLMISVFEPHHPEWLLQHGQLQDGNYAVYMPYFNSTVVVSPQGQLLLSEIKKSVADGNYRYEFIYPEQFKGVFVYKITYR